MEDKTINYKGIMPDNKKLFFRTVIFVVGCLFLAYVIGFWKILVDGILYFTGHFFFWIVLCAIIAVLSSTYRIDYVSIKPEGQVHVSNLSKVKGDFFFWSDSKWPMNSYGIWGNSNDPDTKVSFLFHLTNIADAYQTSRIVPGPKMRIGFGSIDPATNLANRNDKTVCIEFKTPLAFSEGGTTKDKTRWGSERPQIHKIYVSVEEPEKLVRDIKSRTAL